MRDSLILGLTFYYTKSIAFILMKNIIIPRTNNINLKKTLANTLSKMSLAGDAKLRTIMSGDDFTGSFDFINKIFGTSFTDKDFNNVDALFYLVVALTTEYIPYLLGLGYVYVSVIRNISNKQSQKSMINQMLNGIDSMIKDLILEVESTVKKYIKNKSVISKQMSKLKQHLNIYLRNIESLGFTVSHVPTLNDIESFKQFIEMMTK